MLPVGLSVVASPDWRHNCAKKTLHPLKIICVTTLSALLLAQLALLLFAGDILSWYWALLLVLPLLLPLPGIIKDRLYTYKWIGFLTLFYFCVGISELISNPQLRIYAYLTTIFSLLLFLGSIYYTRYLRLKQ